jgi:LuxR family maltose regulon positive regulatory protein
MEERTGPTEPASPGFPLLQTKLNVPQVRRELVRRPRLTSRLDDALQAGRKLTLLSAPAGFGKTTLLSEWIGGAPPVAWVSLDGRDNDPARFWAYLLTALDGVWPGAVREAKALLHAPQPPPIEAVVTVLLNEIVAASGAEGAEAPPCVLILDDYHLIQNPAIHQGLAFLLDHLPPQMHLLISSRADPTLPLARLRARDQLTELRTDDLRFSAEEAAAFLKQVMGLSLSAEDVAVLETRTEGWIAGLQLAALSVQRRDAAQIAEFVAAFSGSHRLVLDYLVQEVLQQQPPVVQKFLLKTSILERLTGPLCDAVLGIRASETRDSRRQVAESRVYELTNSRLMLEQLEAANLFIVPLDDERRWYRYHRLFADLLRDRLQQARPDEVPELHRRAAAWYRQERLTPEAVGHALAAADFELAANLIKESADEMLWMRGEVATLCGWLEMLPEALVRDRPGLCLVHAWALFLGAQFEAVEARVRDAEAALARLSLPDPARQAVAEQLIVMRAMLANFRGDIPRTVELSRQALDRVAEDNLMLRAALASNLGGAYMGIGDLVAAGEVFAEAARLYQATGKLFVTLLSTAYLGDVLMAQGHLRQAEETFRRTLALAGERGGAQSFSARLAQVGLGRLENEWNKLGEAESRLTVHLEASQRLGDEQIGPGPQLLVDGYRALARVLQARGEGAGAWAMLDRAEQVARRRAPQLLGPVAAARARLHLACGDLAAAQRWASESGLDANTEPSYAREFELLTLARVLVAAGSLTEALDLLERLGRAAEAGQRLGSLVEARLLQALALQAQGRRVEAVAALDTALSLAEPEGYVRLFAEEGAPLAQLVRQAAAQGIGAAARLQAALAAAPVLPPERGVPPSPLVEPLSERELEVLQHLADGLSNREIAAKLVLAVTTVKKHASNIYGKLGVRSRTEAVARARDLGLL